MRPEIYGMDVGGQKRCAVCFLCVLTVQNRCHNHKLSPVGVYLTTPLPCPGPPLQGAERVTAYGCRSLGNNASSFHLGLSCFVIPKWRALRSRFWCAFFGLTPLLHRLQVRTAAEEKQRGKGRRLRNHQPLLHRVSTRAPRSTSRSTSMARCAVVSWWRAPCPLSAHSSGSRSFQEDDRLQKLRPDAAVNHIVIIQSLVLIAHG